MEKAQQARNENDIGAMKDSASLLATNYIQEYMDKRYVQMLDGFATTYTNAGAYAKYKFPNATEGGFTYEVTGDTLKVTNPATGNTVSGTILDNGNIEWNSTGTSNNNNQQQEEEDMTVSSNPIIFTYNVLTEPTTAKVEGVEEKGKVADNSGSIKVGTSSTNGTVEITGLDCDYILDYEKNKSNLEELSYWESEYGNFAQDFLIDSTKLIIPSKVKLSKNENDEYYYDTTNGQEYTVTKIGDNALATYGDSPEYYIQQSISEVVLPNTITVIGSGSFNACLFEKINIPSSVTNIGSEAFSYSTNLTSISIPNNVSNIGSSAFYNCSSLQSITAPFGQGNIGSSAFDNCDSIEELYFSDGITSIGEEAFSCFSYFPSMVTEITIPNGVTTIGYRAFYDCSYLEKINLPNTITSIGGGAFEDCSNLTSINLPSSISTIGTEAFKGCSSISTLTIPNSITRLENNTFESCESLQTISLPNNLAYLGPQVFNYCSSLQTLTIPSSITTLNDLGVLTDATINLPSEITHIYVYAFANCSNCTINFGETRAKWNSLTLVDENGDAVSEDEYELDTENVTIHCTDDT